MKKIFLLCSALFLSIQPIHAQVQLGAQYGLLFMQDISRSDDHVNNDYTAPDPSWFLSITVRARHASVFNMGGEFEYVHRRFHVESSEGGVSGTTDYNLDVSVDQARINLQPQFTFGKKFKFFFYPGLYLAYNFHSHVWGTSSYSGSGKPWDKNIDVWAYGYPRAIEIGLMFGMGMDFTVWRGLAIVFETAGSINLVPTSPEWAGSGSVNTLARISLGVAYSFPR